MKKILFLEWDSFGNPFMKSAFREAGFSVADFPFPQSTVNTRNDEKLATDLAKKIMEEDADAVFSFNYFPVAAIAAAACKVKYISWTYDSPSVQLYSKTIDFPTNYAFVFDSYDVYRLNSLGAMNVYELPMAAADYSEITVSDKLMEAYGADITMIGSMYSEEKHGFVKRLDNLDDYAKGFVKGVCEAQKKLYGISILEKSLSEDMVQRLQKVAPITGSGDGYETAAWTLANYFLARACTAQERKEYLEVLSQHFSVKLFTPSPTPFLKNVQNMGTLKYYEDAPRAMKAAKINLNISLRSIVNGIPLRCMDVFGCGGFLLTNYQSDFEKYFVAGEDYDYFDSKESLLDKANYYLKNDKERQDMAKSAFDKVRREHTFAKRLETMLEVTRL